MSLQSNTSFKKCANFHSTTNLFQFYSVAREKFCTNIIGKVCLLFYYFGVYLYWDCIAITPKGLLFVSFNLLDCTHICKSSPMFLIADAQQRGPPPLRCRAENRTLRNAAAQFLLLIATYAIYYAKHSFAWRR